LLDNIQSRMRFASPTRVSCPGIEQYDEYVATVDGGQHDQAAPAAAL
jgi:hypothetical protein